MRGRWTVLLVLLPVVSSQDATTRLAAYNSLLAKSESDVNTRSAKFVEIEKSCNERLQSTQTYMNTNKVNAAKKQAEISMLSEQIVEGADEQGRNDKLKSAIEARKLRIINQRDADLDSFTANEAQINSISDAVDGALTAMADYAELGQPVITILQELKSACSDAVAKISAKEDESNDAYNRLHSELTEQIKASQKERTQNAADVATWNVQLEAARDAFEIAEGEALVAKTDYDAVDTDCKAKYSSYEIQQAQAKSLQNDIIEIRNVWQTAAITGLPPTGADLNAKMSELNTNWLGRCGISTNAATALDTAAGDKTGELDLEIDRIQLEINAINQTTLPGAELTESTASGVYDTKAGEYTAAEGNYTLVKENCTDTASKEYVDMFRQVQDLQNLLGDADGVLTSTDSANIQSQVDVLNAVLSELSTADVATHTDTGACAHHLTALETASIAKSHAANALELAEAAVEGLREKLADLNDQKDELNSMKDHVVDVKNKAVASDDLTAACSVDGDTALWTQIV